VNNAYREQIEAAGLKVSGPRPTASWWSSWSSTALHPYYVATQAHPEFKSRPTKAHPLFAGLIAAAVERRRSQRLFTEEAAHA
jgi:CTP synthase